jgi:dihydroorotate dehydrogenase electron transfer subunit
MNIALRDLAVARGVPFWISLENVMPCGFGACFGCVIPSRDGSRYRRVCVEGPAFAADDLPAVF